MTTTLWNADLYDTHHQFVSSLATDLVDLLAPRAGETIIDLGCGTGTLAAEIARGGATASGVDASAAMVEQARGKFPALSFTLGDARTFEVDVPVDAIFSNATLHWVRPPQDAIARMHAALKSGGRLVTEFGGFGNVRNTLAAVRDAGARLGFNLENVIDINYFPSIPEYTALLAAGGFETTCATLFDRPTRLDDGERGLSTWYRMFRPGVFDVVPKEQHETLLEAAATLARPKLWKDNAWFADYRRLRLVAHKL